MHKEQYAALHDWFSRYVEASYRETPGFGPWIDLKNEHTRRVCDIITRIGRSLYMSEEDLLLAGIVALLHDVGRFRQIHLYGTFNDRCSENHAILGSRVLTESRILRDLHKGEADIIIKAVELHNLRDLPNDLPDRLLLFAKLIQDADKLDIIRIFTLHYCGESEDYNTVLDSHLPDSPGYSSELIEDILLRKLGNYKDVKNRNDRKLLHLSWIYGIHFKYTLSEIEKGGYVDKIVEVLPRTEVVGEIHGSVRAYMTGEA